MDHGVLNHLDDIQIEICPKYWNQLGHIFFNNQCKYPVGKIEIVYIKNNKERRISRSERKRTLYKGIWAGTAVWLCVFSTKMRTIRYGNIVLMMTCNSYVMHGIKPEKSIGLNGEGNVIKQTSSDATAKETTPTHLKKIWHRSFFNNTQEMPELWNDNRQSAMEQILWKFTMLKSWIQQVLLYHLEAITAKRWVYPLDIDKAYFNTNGCKIVNLSDSLQPLCPMPLLYPLLVLTTPPKETLFQWM